MTDELNNKREKFPRIKYKDSILKYGNDKPDLRNPIENFDATEIFKNSKFEVFAKNIIKNQVVRAIPVKNHGQSMEFFKTEMQNFVKKHGAEFGIAYMIFDEDDVKTCPIKNAYIKTDSNNETNGWNELIKKIKNLEFNYNDKTVKLNDGDAVLFACGNENFANKLAGIVRTELGNRLKLINENDFKFCWIVDFPYFEWNEDNKKIDFVHNPFSKAKCDTQYLEDFIDGKISKEELLKTEAWQYDIVCNGIELSSGGLRNYDINFMYKAFEICGYNKKEIDIKFSGMINAFKFGTPPTGGIAPGIDRIVMLLAKTENIRDITAFPMTGKAEDLLMKAPSDVSEKQLKELGIKIDKK